MLRYIVKKGDTLCAISKRYYGTSVKYHEIASMNRLINPHRLREGQTLDLPPLKPSVFQKNISLRKDNYTVLYGDTLWKIADKMLASPNRWPEIARLNRLNNPNHLLIGGSCKNRFRGKI